MSHLDQKTEPIADRFLAYLREQLDDRSITYDLPLVRLSGGYVTSIYRFRPSGPGKERDRSLVLRLYPESDSPESAVWEGCVQNALAAQGNPVARVYHVCTDKSVLGGAFLVMDFLPGELLITAPVAQIPEILGQAHAVLHQNDPQILVTALNEQNINEGQHRLDKRSDLGDRVADEFPWTREGIDWLTAHRPPKPLAPAVCHGDFHPLNILVQEGAVTGLLDWSDCLIAEPVWDVANTILRLIMPFKYLVAPRLGAAFEPIDWDELAQAYVDVYCAQNPAGITNLDYYRARQSIYSLVEGVRGHPVWRYPPIVRDLVELVRHVTGIQITMPD